MHSPLVQGLTNDALISVLLLAIHTPHPELCIAAIMLQVMLFTSDLVPLNGLEGVQHMDSALQQHFAVAACFGLCLLDSLLGICQRVFGTCSPCECSS